MKKICLFAVCLLSAISSSMAQSNEMFTNPVIHGDLADPTVIRWGKSYYAAGTSSEWAPSYPVYKSDDLVNWEQTGHVFAKQPEWTCGSFWAPELYLHNDKVYMYYTARRKSDGQSYIGVATASRPDGEYTDHGPIIVHGNEDIDAFVWEDDGQLYISWKAYGLAKRPIEIMACKLSDDGLHLKGETFTLLRDDEKIGMEGQCMFKKDGYYYLLYSVRGCCGPKSDYAVHVARSKEIKGPYEKYSENPILSGGRDVLSCGHGTLVNTPDNRMYYLCHAYFTGDNFFAGRQPILQELVMGEDHWPHFVGGPMASTTLPLPLKKNAQKPLTGYRDEFKGKELNVSWSWNYTDSDVKARLRKGTLCLAGTAVNGKDAPAVLCQRPGGAEYRITTQVVNQNNSLKGLTFYGDAKAYLAFGIKGHKLLLEVIHDGNKQELFASEVADKAIWLRMEVNRGCDCSFQWSSDGKNWNKVTVLEGNGDYGQKMLRWDRVARPGLIHQGSASEPACFSEFDMEYLK